jgi:GNAT superfamily N-acetyltransferase
VQIGAEFTVRNATTGDIGKLAEVERSAASVFVDFGLAWIAEAGTTDPAVLNALCRNGTLWVAVGPDDEPVGFLAAHQLDGSFYIAEVSVARSHQRRGIGAALIDTATRHARDSGFPCITLTTYRDLSWNGPFYSGLGFEEAAPSEPWPGHAKQLRLEVATGHDASRRCIMFKRL